MFSQANYLSLPNVEVSALLRVEWQKLSTAFNLHAILLVQVEACSETLSVVSSHNCPYAPFNGSEKQYLIDVLKSCFDKFPKAHIHAIGELALSNLVRKYSHSEGGINKTWFVPVNFEGKCFVFLGFPPHDSKIKSIPPEFAHALSSVLFVISATSGYRDLVNRIGVMEQFIKEVGHDMASSIQATTATLRNISQARITGPAVLRKAREVEDELWAAYRTAENLGIVVDPDYQMQQAAEYDLIDVINRVVEHHRSESEERQNSIKFNFSMRSITMWGDRNAIEVTLGHLILNAIKYSFDASYITITINEDGRHYVIRISNKGVKLPSGDDYHTIWDFGVRGKDAIDNHVNGSGIGLYTAKKIILAHGGSIAAESDPVDKNVTYFYVKLPKPASGLKAAV